MIRSYQLPATGFQLLPHLFNTEDTEDTEENQNAALIARNGMRSTHNCVEHGQRALLTAIKSAASREILRPPKADSE